VEEEEDDDVMAEAAQIERLTEAGEQMDKWMLDVGCRT
jgi:hypothetical protein